eukprot:2423580-Pyramimonas_sp.AAC.1
MPTRRRQLLASDLAREPLRRPRPADGPVVESRRHGERRGLLVGAVALARLLVPHGERPQLAGRLPQGGPSPGRRHLLAWPEEGARDEEAAHLGHPSIAAAAASLQLCNTSALAQARLSSTLGKAPLALVHSGAALQRQRRRRSGGEVRRPSSTEAE